MRQITEVLRLHAQELSYRQIDQRSFSGSELGFRFQSNPGVSSDRGFAEMGTERNGVFL